MKPILQLFSISAALLAISAIAAETPAGSLEQSYRVTAPPRVLLIKELPVNEFRDFGAPRSLAPGFFPRKRRTGTDRRFTRELAAAADWTAAKPERYFSIVPKFDPFYKKHVSVGGFPVVSSEKVSDFALLEAAWVVGRMLKDRPDILSALANSNTRLSIMAVDEMTTTVPEHSDLKPAKFWDRRARGLGATPSRPAVSCGEENVLRYVGDPYFTESIIVHEFAHAIHHMGLAAVDKTFDRRLKAIYERAMAKGLWEDKYAANNRAEYWAEGVQSFFDTNRKPDHDHNHVDTREELLQYDAELATLIAEVFRNTKWRYVRPEERAGQTHLKGYDPSKAPRFAWPADLDAWYKQNYTKKGRKR